MKKVTLRKLQNNGGGGADRCLFVPWDRGDTFNRYLSHYSR